MENLVVFHYGFMCCITMFKPTLNEKRIIDKLDSTFLRSMLQTQKFVFLFQTLILTQKSITNKQDSCLKLWKIITSVEWFLLRVGGQSSTLRKVHSSINKSIIKVIIITIFCKIWRATKILQNLLWFVWRTFGIFLKIAGLINVIKELNMNIDLLNLIPSIFLRTKIC